MKGRHIAFLLAVAAVVNLTAQLYRWPGYAVVALTVAAGLGAFAIIDHNRA